MSEEYITFQEAKARLGGEGAPWSSRKLNRRIAAHRVKTYDDEADGRIKLIAVGDLAQLKLPAVRPA